MSREAHHQAADLLDAFQGLLIAGRWLLVAAETVATGLLLSSAEPIRGAIPALSLLFLYNAVSLVIVHRVPMRRVPVGLLLALDVLFVAVAAHYTGGSGSPFLGQYYLILLAAALFYGLPGGLMLGITAAVLSGLLALQSPGGAWEDLRNLAAYFVIVGGFTGYLTDRLKTWFQGYQESQVQIHRARVQSEVARREMELARSIQQAALPAGPPQVPGLEIAARLEFAREVGGDFYLFLPERQRIGLIVGDVSGKGIPAALISTTIAHLLPSLKPLEDPAQALNELNRDLAERLPAGEFVTLILACVDAAAGRLHLWNAGHPPALLWCAQEKRVKEARVHNPLLGMFPSWDCQAEEWPLAIGDALLLYSDGLIETRNADGELFGVCRTAEVLAEHAQRSAGEIAQALVAAVRAWGALSDDLTILVCRRVAAAGGVMHG